MSLAPKNLVPKRNIIIPLLKFAQDEPTTGQCENPKQSQRNSIPLRQPHWTDAEVRTLLQECDRYRDVMVSRTLIAAEDLKVKKSKEEKQQVWETITETINTIHGGASDTDSGKCSRRTVKCVVKKWVNLISKMKNEFAIQKRNPKASICGTSRAVRTILYTDDELDLDEVLGPIPQSSSNEHRHHREPLPEIPDDSDQSNKFQNIAPRPELNLVLNVDKSDENMEDNQQNQDSNEETSFKRKGGEIDSIGDDTKLSPRPWSHKKPRKYRKKGKKNLNDYSDCWQRRIPNGNILGISSVFPNNSAPIKIAIPRNPVQNLVLKNEIPSNIFLLGNEVQSNNINSVQSEIKVKENCDNVVDNKVICNEGDVIQNCVNSNDVSIDENSEEEFQTTQNPEPLNGDMYTDDFMQLNKEVLELKKQKLLTKIDKLVLEREKAVYDKERAIIEKETAKMAHEKMQLELETLKRSLGKHIKNVNSENLLDSFINEPEKGKNEITEETINKDSESHDSSHEEYSDNEI